jgi:hypothetical protein
MLQRVWKSVGEKDVQLVKDVSPERDGHRPFCLKALHGQEHEFEDRLIVREDASGLDRLAKAAVHRFNGVRGVDETPEFGHEAEHRTDLCPVVAPGITQSGIAAFPCLFNAFKHSQRLVFGRRGVHAFEVPRHGFAVFVGNQRHGVTEQVHDAGLVRALREGRLQGFGEARQPVGRGNQDVLNAAVRASR